jgi:predicted ATPase
MRLKTLTISEFKNLKDFHIAFADAFTTVLVGPNGTGKSNVLEALAIIFRDLDLGARPAFSYELEYCHKNATIRVVADHKRKKSPAIIQVDGQEISARRFSRRGGGKYLPSFVFGYYSGASSRMESHFALHQKRFADDLLKGADQSLRPLLYARLVHSQFVLLSFFQRLDQDRDILRDFLRIEDLESVLFVLRRPNWFSKGRKKSGDTRFWGARGVVQKLLDQLYRLSLAPLGVRGGDGELSRLYLFLKDKHDLMSLAQAYEGQQDFFKALESLYISDLIEDVRTNVKIRGVNGSLTFRELSEGEQQLLMVLGLLRFIEAREGLILLDEPDTHLNPSWSLQYTALLKEHVPNQETTQVVMATHDPLVVSGLTADEVQLMRRSGEGQISASHPEDDPKGMGVAGVLTSELYGLRSALDKETQDLLDRKRELAIKDDLDPMDMSELRELNERVGKLDFTNIVRDPLYRPFVEAMTAVEAEFGLRDPLLSPEQLDLQADLAKKIVRALRREIER